MLKNSILMITLIVFANTLYAQKKTVITDTLSTTLDKAIKSDGEKLFIRNMVKKYESGYSAAYYIKTLKSDIPGEGKYESVKLYSKTHQLIKDIHFNKYFEPDTKKEYYYNKGKSNYTLEYSYAPEDGWLQVDSTHTR